MKSTSKEFEQEFVSLDVADDVVKAVVQAAYDIDQNMVQALARLSAATAMAADIIGCPDENMVENLLAMAADMRRCRNANHPANAAANRGN